MRPFVLPFVVWLGALQVYFPAGDARSISAIAELLSGAAALAGLTVAVYRLGVWRQEMRHTKDSVVAELARFRNETQQNFARLEHRIDQLEDRWQKAVA